MALARLLLLSQEMRTLRHELAQLGVLLALCAGCGDHKDARDEKDAATGKVVHVAEFRVNECGSGTPSSKLLMDRDPQDYPNLRCVAWQRTDAKLSVDLINFQAGCGFQGWESDTLWKGGVREDASKLDFDVTWDFGSPNACGDCLHDFSFTLEDIRGEDPLDMQVSVRDCSDCDARTSSLTLPTDEHASGLTCSYLERRGFLGVPDARLGALNAPSKDGACDEGLELIKVHDEEICVPKCSSDDDCHPSDALTCQQGKCVLSAPW